MRGLTMILCRTMRMYLKCALQWVLAIVLIQVVVYYWVVNKKARPEHKHVRRTLPAVHPSLASMRNRTEGTCSYDTCAKVKRGVLNVHLVPHGHIDVGWLKSVEEYYTGQGDGDYGNTMYGGCVRCILNNTLQELMKNPARTFIFAEMKYFSRFWHDASIAERNNIRQLIKERRLEIVNGGWVMSDAGITVYNDIIDQHTLGFDFIRETLGPCAQTRTGWHVDQFGHSSEHASIFAQMGYDSLFVGRISDFDKEKRISAKELEMVWLTSEKNLGNRSALFTHVTFDGYYAPHGYVLENLNKNVFKAPGTLRNFIITLQNRAANFKTNHLLVPMGSDFGYRKPDLWFENMDDAIALVKSIKLCTKKCANIKKKWRKRAARILQYLVRNGNRRDVNLIYSTPSCYAYHVNQEMKFHQKDKEYFPFNSKSSTLLPTKKDDFLPYVTDAVWAGFYTTRGGFKRHIWQAGQILQSCKQLSIFSAMPGEFQRVNVLRDAMAVMQHHDAITGTQKRQVLESYNSMLSRATERCEKVMVDAYIKLWGKDIAHQLSTPQFCHNLNISSCEVSEDSDDFLVTVYNPLSWYVYFPLRIPVEPGNYFVYDKDQKPIPYQMVPVPNGIQDIPERSDAAVPTEMVFMTTLPPLSVTSFLVKTDQEEESKVPKPQFSEEKDEEIVIENKHIALFFSRRTGLLNSMRNKASQLRISISQEFNVYIPPMTQRNEGAYVFVPGIEPARPVRGDKPVTIKVIRGEEVQEVHQTFDKSVTQVVRLHNGSKFAEFQWTVGRLSVSQSSGVDIVSQFSTSLASGDIFYTDSNGREMIERKRSSWKIMPEHKIAGNYFPVTSRIFIRDQELNAQLTLFPDRPQGGTSLRQGSLEIMVHRRSVTDDGLGMQEPLNDMGSDKEGIIYTGKHYLYLDDIENCGLPIRRKAWETQMAPTIMFTEVNHGRDLKKAVSQIKFLNAELMPDNVHLLTLDRITKEDSTLLLIRLEHALEKSENGGKNQDAIVDLEELFTPFDVVSVEETTLGGNFNPKEVERLEWVSEKAIAQKYIGSPDFQAKMVPPFRVKLSNMEIRTFRIKIVYKES